MSGTHESRHGGARVRLPPPLVFVSGMLAGSLVNAFVRAWPLPLARGPRVLLAGALALAGGALIGWALVHFRRTQQEPEPWKPTPELIPDGPYRFTRNPMYVGMTLVQCAIAGVVDSVWVLLLAPVSLLVVHLTAVLPEERYLTERFGEPYVGYTRRVPRYLGPL